MADRAAIRVRFNEVELDVIRSAIELGAGSFPDDLTRVIREATMQWALERLRDKGYRT